MPGMMKKKKDMRMSYMNGKEVNGKKVNSKRKKMRMGTRYGMSDGGPAVMASMENQKPN